MHCTWLMYLLPLLISFSVSCHVPKPNPESDDPIYFELKTKAEHLKTEVATFSEQRLGAKKEYDSAPMRTGQKPAAEETYLVLDHLVRKSLEEYRYYSILAEKRLKSDREFYMKAFKENKPWPDPNEYTQYKILNKLKNSSRTWDPTDRINARYPATKPASGKESHGEDAEDASSHSAAHE